MGIEQAVFIPVEHGQLEAHFYPHEEGKAIAIMCHPHSLMGGAMQNKVVTTVVKAWQQLGFHTLRFNFRGVGKSTGAFAQGIGEMEDVRATVDFMRSKCSESLPLYLGGFSFGAYVVLKFCQNYLPQALWLLAPPAQYPDFDSLNLPAIANNFLITAGADEVVDTPKILQWATKQPFKEVVNIPDSSHFFHSKLLILRDIILNQARTMTNV